MVTPENGVQNIKSVATIAVSIFIMILYQDSDMFLSVIFGNNCSVCFVSLFHIFVDVFITAEIFHVRYLPCQPIFFTLQV